MPGKLVMTSFNQAQKVTELVETMDENGDGALNFEEFSAWLRIQVQQCAVQAPVLHNQYVDQHDRGHCTQWESSELGFGFWVRFRGWG